MPLVVVGEGQPPPAKRQKEPEQCFWPVGGELGHPDDAVVPHEHHHKPVDVVLDEEGGLESLQGLALCLG